MDVTLWGNFTKIEAPYKALLISHYANTSETMSRTIESIVSNKYSSRTNKKLKTNKNRKNKYYYFVYLIFYLNDS